MKNIIIFISQDAYKTHSLSMLCYAMVWPATKVGMDVDADAGANK